MDIKKFALRLREELLRERNPIKVAEKINSCNFSDEEKRQIISYLKDAERSTESNNLAFLDLVSEVEKRIIGENKNGW